MSWLFRFPGVFYRAHLGWLLGGRFLQLTVRGRKTGRLHRVVLEVVGRDPATGGLIIASGWGERSQWFQNVRADPRVGVHVGGRRFDGEASVLSEDAATELLLEYARRHRFAYRWFIGPIFLGHRPASPEEFSRLAATVPILLVRPAA